MKSIAIVMLVFSIGGSTAFAAKRRSAHFGPEPRYDPSLDFSRQFDEEIKWERDHPLRQRAPDDREIIYHPKRRHRRHKRR